MLKILTLNWQGASKLTSLLPGLLSNLKDIPFEWWIKDNASTDDSIKIIKELNNPNIKLIEYSHNRDSFSEGMNYLFHQAKPEPEDDILLLNNDIIFNDTTSISEMLKVLHNDPEVGIVGARLYYTNTNKLQHAGVVFLANKLPTHFRSAEISSVHDSLNREFQAVTGAVWLTKAKYYQNICTTNPSKLPGLSERYVWSFEDVDACLNIKYVQKKKIVYCGKTNIFHEESASLKKNPVNKMFMNKNAQNLLRSWSNICKADIEDYRKSNNHNLYKLDK